MRLLRIAGLFTLGLVAVAAAVTMLPPFLLHDAPVPSSLAPFMAEARHKIRTEATDGFRLPLHLRFVEARCSTDGRRAVALIFEEWQPPYLNLSYAIAWRGSMPTVENNSWGGGVGMRSVETDPEFVHVIGPNTGTCE